MEIKKLNMENRQWHRANIPIPKERHGQEEPKTRPKPSRANFQSVALCPAARGHWGEPGTPAGLDRAASMRLLVVALTASLLGGSAHCLQRFAAADPHSGLF